MELERSTIDFSAPKITWTRRLIIADITSYVPFSFFLVSVTTKHYGHNDTPNSEQQPHATADIPYKEPESRGAVYQEGSSPDELALQH